MSPVPSSGPAVCAACGAQRERAYCPECGQRGPRPEDESLGHFLREGLSVITSADSKLWRSLRALFVPGKLTAEHFGGRRGLYLHPVRLLILLNVLFFIALSNAGGSVFRGPLQSHEDAGFYGRYAMELAERQRARWGASERDYEVAFDAQADGLAPTLIGLLVPLFAIVLWFVLLPWRQTFLRHLVFATHAVSTMMAILLVLLVVGSLLLYGLALAGFTGWIDSGAGVDPVVVPASVLAIVAYFVLGIRRVYGLPWWAAGVTGVTMGTLGMVSVLVAYRFALFCVTVLTLNPPA